MYGRRSVTRLLVTAWDLLTLARPKLGRILRGTAALWAIGAATIVIKFLGADPRSDFFEVNVGPVGRLMLILNVYWLNLKTLVWPMNLAVYYWRVTPKSFLEPGVLLGAIALGLTCLLLWRLRRRKRILFGLVWFGLALGPSSQVLTHHIHRADRFLYLPLVGLTVAVAMGLRPLGQVLSARTAVAGVVTAGGLILLLLGVRSGDQLQTWRDSLTMWEHCVEVSPDNAFAHDRLASYLKLRGESRRAKEHALRALELDFADNQRALLDRALQLATSPDERLRNYGLALRLARRACKLTGWSDPEYLRTLAIVHCSVANAQAANRQFTAALENYYKAIEADDQYDAALFNLAILRTNCRDEKLRNPHEAVRLAERACKLTEAPNAHRLSILAMAYLAAGRRDMAVATGERVVRAARAAGDAELAESVLRWVRSQQDDASLPPHASDGNLEETEVLSLPVPGP